MNMYKDMSMSDILGAYQNMIRIVIDSMDLIRDEPPCKSEDDSKEDIIDMTFEEIT